MDAEEIRENARAAREAADSIGNPLRFLRVGVSAGVMVLMNSVMVAGWLDVSACTFLPIFGFHIAAVFALFRGAAWIRAHRFGPDAGTPVPLYDAVGGLASFELAVLLTAVFWSEGIGPAGDWTTWAMGAVIVVMYVFPAYLLARFVLKR